MSLTAQESPVLWTAVDLVERLGAIPLNRVRTNPAPGSATERDVIEVHDRENRLYELLDGTLLEKTVGNYESYLAGVLIQLLGAFVQQKGLGIVMPPDGHDASGSWAGAAARRLVHFLATVAGAKSSAQGDLGLGPRSSG